jgi:hypothetical protein
VLDKQAHLPEVPEMARRHDRSSHAALLPTRHQETSLLDPLWFILLDVDAKAGRWALVFITLISAVAIALGWSGTLV